MEQPFASSHYLDNGKPAGGVSAAIGIDIQWQNGPLGRGDTRIEPNGAFVETVIAIAIDRLNFYQAGQFACVENQSALDHLRCALQALNARTNRRESAGVEGTHDGN